MLEITLKSASNIQGLDNDMFVDLHQDTSRDRDKETALLPLLKQCVSRFSIKVADMLHIKKCKKNYTVLTFYNFSIIYINI